MRPDPTVMHISPEALYLSIDKCNNKTFKVTYCALKLNDQCITTRKSIIKIVKVHKDYGFIEGLILKDNEPLEDIILKINQVYKIESIK